MKKTRVFLICAAILALICLFLVGCSSEDKISSISLKDHTPDTVIEIVAGEFNYGAYTLVVSYESERTEEISLTEEMISKADRLKLYQVGDHDITASYGEYKCVFKVSVKRAAFEDLAFPANNVFTYDGKAHTVEVDGTLPANAIVTYPSGNSFVNAGTYNVTALVSCEGYVTARLATTVTIERAKYDMSGVKFESREFVYDGRSHSIAISGTLPEGVSAPTYTIDGNSISSVINAGEYKVKASFANKSVNYEDIPPMEATLTILPAEYTIKGVDLVFKNEDGKTINGYNKVYEGMFVTFDLNDYYEIYGKATVSFSVYDEDGNLISASNTATNIMNVGKYKVVADFQLEDSHNYKPIDPVVRIFEIKKAEYAIGDIYFETGYFEYDKNPHSIHISGNIPEDCSVDYEYYLNGNLVTDEDGKPVNEVIDAGRYIVKAIFSHDKENYGEVESLSAVLQITPTALPVSQMHFIQSATEMYDGTARFLEYVGELPEGITAIYEYYLGNVLQKDGEGKPVTSVVNAGEYIVKVSFHNTNKNYTVVSDIECELVIDQVDIDITGVTVNGAGEHIYNGSNISPTVAGIPETVKVTEMLYRVDGEGNRTAVPSAVDFGEYLYVVTLLPEDAINYNLVGEAVREIEFSIAQCEINVSNINLSQNSLEYNGEAQTPTLSDIPEHVEITSITIYTYMGSDPLEQVKDAGRYRCEITLATDNPNYVLSSNEKQIIFEITPMKIDVSGLVFGQTQFTYDGNRHYPVLLDIPEHVMAITKCYWGDDETDDREYADGKYLALDVGTYGYKVTLTAENNYELVGPTNYVTTFSIVRQVIDITPYIPETYVFEYKAEGYSDEYIKSVIMENMISGVGFTSVGVFYKLDEESGTWNYYNNYLKNPTDGADIAAGKYYSEVTLYSTLGGNVFLKYNETQGDQIHFKIYFTVSSPS